MSTAAMSDEGVDPASQHRAGLRRLEVAVAVVILAFVLGGLSLAFRSNALIADLPITEDAYYAFSVSRNVAEGNGVTIDGSRDTNGFQPLFTFVTVPLFLAGGDFLPLRLVLLLQVAIFAATGWVLGLVVRDAVPTPRVFGGRGAVLLSMALYLAASFAMRTHLNGLETGCVLLLNAIIWRWYQCRGIQRTAGAVTLGVLFGLLVLTRIDALFAVAVFSLVYVVRRRAKLAEALLEVCVLGATVAFVSAPWWIYNTVVFGSLLPTSGAAEQLWALDPHRLSNLVRAASQAAVPWVYLGTRFDGLWPVSMILSMSGLVLWRVNARGRARKTPTPEPQQEERSARASEFLVVLVLVGCALAIWYGASSWAVHFYSRYLAVLVLPAVYLWSALALAIGGRLTRPLFGLMSLVALAGLTYAMTFHSAMLFAGSDFWRDQVPLVATTVPDSEVVAAGQSGTLGYFRNRVLNLDGMVNADALAHRANIPQYLVRQKVHWLCDEPRIIQRYLGEEPAALGWIERAHQGAFACYERVGRAR